MTKIEIGLSILAMLAAFVTIICTGSSGWAGGNNHSSGRDEEVK